MNRQGRSFDAVPVDARAVLSSSGEPLDEQSRAYFEPRFGHDFSQVRIHADTKAAESARALHAKAYTVGRDVVFGANRFAPSTMQGRTLFAHELAHTIQQREVQVAPASGASQEVLESSADSAAREVGAGRSLSVALPACSVGLARSPLDSAAQSDDELTDELNIVGDKLRTPHYLGRNQDVWWFEELQAAATANGGRPAATAGSGYGTRGRLAADHGRGDRCGETRAVRCSHAARRGSGAGTALVTGNRFI